jgi:hypothetical protein
MCGFERERDSATLNSWRSATGKRMANMDDLLIAIIIAGVGLSSAYLRAELLLHRRYKAAERRREGVQRELLIARVHLEQNGMSRCGGTVVSPIQINIFRLVRVLTGSYAFLFRSATLKDLHGSFWRRTLHIVEANRHQSPTRSIAIRSLGNALAFVTVACLFASPSAAGEDAPAQQPLTPGMRVRILDLDISPSKVVGTISRVDDQSVTIDVPGRSEPVAVLREKIARLDVSTGRGSRWLDAAIGGAIGAAGSALACSAGETKNSIVPNSEVTGSCAVLGAALGALIGAIIPPREHWNEMPATRYRLSFAPRLDHGLDLALASNF